MAKIQRLKDVAINLDTGEVTQPIAEPWSVALSNQYAKCQNLADQISNEKKNIVDETNITAIAYSLVAFQEKGKGLFHQVCFHCTLYDTEQLNNIWDDAIKRSKKKPTAFIKICREKGLEATLVEDETAWPFYIKERGKTMREITEELTEQDINNVIEYHHLEYNNAYYFATFERTEDGQPKRCVLECKSNFIMRILYHITRGKNNKRVIVLKNVRGRELVLDVETSQIASFNKFKELTEGAGNFLFEGSQLDLMKIKNRLFDQEKPCVQIDVLGWNKEGFFTFCNGIYNSTFHAVDKYGIVSHGEHNYFIPYHPGTDESTNVNEKKFAFKDSPTTWDQWSTLYYKTFGDAAMPCLVFGVATLYSDAIFSLKNNFPMIFLYGEGGSGKSSVVAALQYLFGHPQPALKLSEKANTDKAKIRKLAQFCNALACLEEYINDLDMSVKKTLTGIYDRFGYERGTIESKFGTETVPIQSTVIVTGNEYPDDDPLLQRLMMIDYNKNVRTEEVNKSYDQLKEINRLGITNITGALLQHRDNIIANFDAVYRQEFNTFKAQYKGTAVPDRMIENNAVLLAVHAILERAGRVWPFKIERMRNYLLECLAEQAQKRDTGAVVQRFWDVVLILLKEGEIKNGREIKVDQMEVSIRFKEIHMYYLTKHFMIYRSRGQSYASLQGKLKDSQAFLVNKTSARFGDVVTNSMLFDYNKLGVDMLSVLDYKQQEAARYTKENSENSDDEKFKLKFPENTNDELGPDDLPF